MFEFNTWVVNNLISGVKNRSFSKEWAALQLANYYVKGKVTEADITRFDEELAPSSTSEISAEIEEKDGEIPDNE